MIHKPVLLKEVIENLNLKPGMIAVDGTLGAGGHSIEILRKIVPDGKLISIDWDKQTIENFQKILTRENFSIKREISASVKNNFYNITPLNIFRPLWRGNQIIGHWCGVNDNYANLDKIFGRLKMNTADAILIDLGFSFDQIKDAERGFSFLHNDNGFLDMRYSPETQKVTAADIINKYSEKKLADVFWKYGEERYARKIAREIVQVREIVKIRKTRELVNIIAKAVPKNYRRGKLHFATKTFQSLRIEVNQELENLKIFLKKAVKILGNKGRLAVISFHSLEDRIVKNFFQKESRNCVCPPKFPECVCRHKARLKIITKKPIQPDEKEIRKNPRARSAKMRVAEKI